MAVDTLPFARGDVVLPAFLPDATRGVVRSIDARDLEECGVQAVMMNTFHLMRAPSSAVVKALGGIHAMYAWQRPIFTDSGGFQIYSLIRQNPRYGSIGENAIIFRPEGSNRKLLLTPEKVVQRQLAYGSNVVVCLDDCTSADDTEEVQRASVERTVRWARRCRREFDRGLAQRKTSDPQPLLMGVIQGGRSRELRLRCAAELLTIGFDCYGFGGWPLDADGQLLREMTAFTRELVPREFPMQALGIGHPESIADCVADGYDLFDSSLPTRDARRGRLYGPWPKAVAGLRGRWFRYTYVRDECHIKNDGPIASGCDCPCCDRMSVGYLHHLFRIGDGLALRLATIHNLRFMTQLMDVLRDARATGVGTVEISR